MRLKHLSSTSLLVIVFCLILAGNSFATVPTLINPEIVPTPSDGGIKLDIPDRFKKRFERWKAELLSTELGRSQWERYANSKHFVLTIKVTRSKGKGAGTDRFQWDDEGRFVGATISLGSDLDEGDRKSVV